MNLQSIIVIGIIAAAILYAVLTLLGKRRAFFAKSGCGDDCGCNDNAKKLTS